MFIYLECVRRAGNSRGTVDTIDTVDTVDFSHVEGTLGSVDTIGTVDTKYESVKIA